MKKLIALSAIAVALAACSDVPNKTTDARQAEETERMVAEADRQVGAPGITNFQERKLVKLLYELRDREQFNTVSYIVDLNGRLHKLCDSIGYGINASIQFVNPQRVLHGPRIDRTAALIPQPEPNGLFMPEGLAATYVFCLDPDDGDIKPLYVEPEVIVSPFPLPSVNG